MFKNETKNIILVEGKNDQTMVEKLIKTKGCNYNYTFNIMDGVNNMKKSVSDVKEKHAGNNIKIFIICDADLSRQDRENQITNTIKGYEKDQNINFAYHIITRPGEEYGIMEDLFLDIFVKEGSVKDFYQKQSIMQLVNDVALDTSADTTKSHYSRKIKAAATSLVRFYNYDIDIDKNDIQTLVDQENGIAKKIMEYDTIKEMLQKIGEHFSLEPSLAPN